MGILDRLFGRDREPEPRPPSPRRQDFGGPTPADTDQEALERYRYLLRTAPPEAIEQAHAEAFAKLTPTQRSQVLQELSQNVPPHERADRDDPRSLARMATRAEVRQPGTLERAFGGRMGGQGVGIGGIIAGSLLGTIAGNVIGTAIAAQLFDDFGAGIDAPGGEPFADAGGDLGDFGGEM